MRILLIDDEEQLRNSLAGFLRKLGYFVECAANGSEGLYKFHLDTYDVVITDIRMPVLDGLEFLRRIKCVNQAMARVIIITGHGDLDNAVKSLKYGAYDYFQKPIEIEDLAAVLRRCAEEKRCADHQHPDQRSADPATLESGGSSLSPFCYDTVLERLRIHSDAMREVIESVKRYSEYRSVPVLIEGETGTGKELIARYLHYWRNNRAEAPFVALNCAAIPDSLFESELFGHERGAYTGATNTGQMGKLELAQGGTVFFDEIGELPMSVQAKLLRVIEERKLFRVGGIKQIDIDIRIISATNRDLQREIRAQRFRADLYYRIGMATIRIPPLRERKEAVLPLAIGFLKRVSNRIGKPFEGFTSAAQKLLIEHSWPGNVRELENVVLGALLKSEGGKIGAENIALAKSDEDGKKEPSSSARLESENFELPTHGLKLEELNKSIIEKALQKNHGNVTKTAQYLGLSRRVLQSRLKKIGLS